MADDTHRKRQELRSAIIELRERGLYSSAKWAAEQLVGLPKQAQNQPESSISKGSQSEEVETSPPEDAEIESSANSVDLDEDHYFLGKAYFDSREYRRAAFSLRKCKGKKAFFLRNYCLYLAGERRKEEESLETSGPLGRCDTVNPELQSLEDDLTEASEKGELDAFGNFLFGMVLKQRSKPEMARKAFILSLQEFPCNWNAWMQLQELCSDTAVFFSLIPQLPSHWTRTFWEASVLLDLHKNHEGLAKFRKLSSEFPESDTVWVQTAMAHYNLRQFDEAQSIFQTLSVRDPFRVDNMDVFSNILYVKEMFAALSFLAHRCVETDKYRPETCCVVGNYFSLKSQHEKAVVHFQRALRLNRNYLSAWTLMGHEYVEMKNTQGAIHAYRRAVDINSRDYRAWYGLGQTYEILSMPHYALYYYRRACQLRPTDPRMWCAMGQCYQSPALSQPEAAARCFRRAVNFHDSEGLALASLAKLCAQLGKHAEAAFYYTKDIERIESTGQQGHPQHLEALLFMAQYMRSQGKFQEAQGYCYRLLDFGGPATEDARAMQREIESVQRHSSPNSNEDQEMELNSSP